jgi:hypothetical protein
MSKLSLCKFAALSFTAMLFACTTQSADSGAPSTSTAESDAEMQSIAPGVSAVDRDNQHVVYVANQAGADWLLNDSQQKYTKLHDQYARTGDASLLPQMDYLTATMHASSANAGNPFLISAPVSDNLAGSSCSDGNGSTCTCAAGCFCISADSGCGCNCPSQPQLNDD